MTTVCRRVARNDSVDLSDASPIRRSPTTGGAESDYDSARSESDLSEREGENGETPRKIDHDEDRSNPQYIPKRGTFYEHDDRTAAGGEDSTVGADGDTPAASVDGQQVRGEEPPADRRVRPRRSNAADKWHHDKYNENEQTPKSRDELIATYGYDIRNEEAPPHARRNRKYGRGPNKYTRQWEDEEAYRRQAQAAAPRRSTFTQQDFPQLEDTVNKDRPKPPAARSPRVAPVEAATNTSQDVRADTRRNGAPARSPRTVTDERKVNITITAANNSNNSSPPQRKVTAADKPQQRPSPPKPQQPNKKTETTPHPTPSDKEKQSIAQPQKPPPPQKPSDTAPTAPAVQPKHEVPGPQPPSLGENRPGSKRYSSLRQRTHGDNLASTPPPVQKPAQTLPQTLPQPQQTLPVAPAQSLPQPGPLRYVQELPAQSPTPAMHPQQMIRQVHRNTPVSQQQHGPSPPHQALPQQQHPQQQHPQQMLQQQLVTHQHALHNISAQHNMTGQIPPSQAYPPQAMMQAAQYMQGGNNAVYPGAPVYAAPPPAPYPHQMYQHHNYTHQPSGGGVTYYSPVEQDPNTMRTQRRPTAAIPIVPPPPNNKCGTTSTEKESIDRIVDNMFVRKQRPAAHAPTTEKTDTSPSPSLTSSSISTDSRPSTERQDSKEISLDSLTLEARGDTCEQAETAIEADVQPDRPLEAVQSSEQISEDPELPSEA